MRTSLNNIKKIEDYLLGCTAPGETLLFEANMLLDTGLADEVAQQRITYEVIKQYSRQKIKAEIIATQEKLTAVPEHQGFIQRIANLFKKH
jgi:hypothetical protein